MTPTSRANHKDLVAFLAHDDLGNDEVRRARLEAELDVAVEQAVRAYPEPDASPCFEADLFRRLDRLGPAPKAKPGPLKSLVHALGRWLSGRKRPQ